MDTSVTSPSAGSQVGRSVPRLEGRDKVTGRAEYTHTMRLPGMLHAKIFRSTGRARPHQVDRLQRGQEGAGRLARRDHRRRVEGVAESLLRAGIPRPADPGARQGALRRRAGGGGARHRPACRRTGRSADRRRLRRAAGGLRRGRGADERRLRARRTEAGRHRSPTSSISRARRTPIPRSTTGCVAATSTRPSPRPSTCSSTSSRRRRCCICRSSRSPRSATTGTAHVTFYDSVARTVVRAHRDRAAARLAGEPGAHQGAVSRRRLRRQALHQAGGAGARAVDDRAAAGEGRARRWRSCSTRSPSIPARSASRAASTRTAASSRASARFSGTAAPMRTSARA